MLRQCMYFLKVESDLDFFKYLCIVRFAILGVAPVTELFNKLLIISINKLYFFCTYIMMVQFSSTQRGHFFHFSSETCLSKKVQSHGLCKFSSFPEPWVGFSKSLGGIFQKPGWTQPLGGIFQKPGWNFPQPWVEISCLPPAPVAETDGNKLSFSYQSMI